MEYPHMRHPEFGLLCPPPRLLRELRIAFTFLLIGGVAGALCVSGILGLRHSETARWQSTDRWSRRSVQMRPPRRSPQDDTELGRPPNSESSAAKPEPAAPGAAPPSSAVAPKARVVRIRGPGESPVIARLPLGRAQSPTPVSAPNDTPLGSTQISVPSAAPDESTAAPSQTLVTQSGAKERLSNDDRRRGRRRRVALRTIVATSPGMIIRGVIILPIIGARAERPRMTSDVARGAAHMRARVPIP